MFYNYDFSLPTRNPEEFANPDTFFGGITDFRKINEVSRELKSHCSVRKIYYSSIKVRIRKNLGFIFTILKGFSLTAKEPPHCISVTKLIFTLVVSLINFLINLLFKIKSQWFIDTERATYDGGQNRFFWLRNEPNSGRSADFFANALWHTWGNESSHQFIWVSDFL